MQQPLMSQLHRWERCAAPDATDDRCYLLPPPPWQHRASVVRFRVQLTLAELHWVGHVGHSGIAAAAAVGVRGGGGRT
jgi:hypothetical protein